MSTSSDDINRRAQSYLTARGRRLEHALGFGKDGSVFMTSALSAIKIHTERVAFLRELDCYLRLQEMGVTEILGLNVPRLVGSDEPLQVIEMTIVEPPFLLDFAGAYLDFPPDFTPEVVEQWEEEIRERFGDRWADVAAVLEVMKERYGIFLFDVHPGNIRFAPADAG